MKGQKQDIMACKQLIQFSNLSAPFVQATRQLRLCSSGSEKQRFDMLKWKRISNAEAQFYCLSHLTYCWQLHEDANLAKPRQPKTERYYPVYPNVSKDLSKFVNISIGWISAAIKMQSSCSFNEELKLDDTVSLYMILSDIVKLLEGEIKGSCRSKKCGWNDTYHDLKDLSGGRSKWTLILLWNCDVSLLDFPKKVACP